MHSFLNWELNLRQANRAGLFSYIKRVLLVNFVQAVEDFAVVLNESPSALLDIQSECSSRISCSYMLHWGSLAGARVWWDFEVPWYFRKQLPQNPEKLSRKNCFSGFFSSECNMLLYRRKVPTSVNKRSSVALTCCSTISPSSNCEKQLPGCRMGRPMIHEALWTQLKHCQTEKTNPSEKWRKLYCKL